jgi:ferredoxin
VRGTFRLRVDPIACTGHGICAELLPELIRLDDWGYPIIAHPAERPPGIRDVKRAIAACPALALRLERIRSERLRRG